MLLASRTVLDISSNIREVVDPLGRHALRSDYDVLRRSIRQSSLDAAPRRNLADAAGMPLYIWDGRGNRLRSTYDVMHRPTGTYLRNEDAPDAPEVLVGRTTYGEAEPEPERHNLRAKTAALFDQAGVATNEAYDFKGNLLRSNRRVAQTYSATLDWASDVVLEDAVYTSESGYDALNRAVRLVAPDGSVVLPSYNEANLLERIDAHLAGC